MAILEVKNISKSFDSLRVLKDISFNVEVGEVVAIIGPSGSGKSTLLRCINQLEKADGGEINVDGVNMFHTENGKAVYAPSKTLRDIRLKIGLVFQNFNLFPHLFGGAEHNRGSCSRSQTVKGGGKSQLRRASEKNGTRN